MRHGKPRHRNLLLSLLTASSLLAQGLAVAPAQAQTGCSFVAGFKALHDLIPAISGDCMENEQHNPQNGDGLQRTTTGLMVWRKADNWTAFTNGSQTWINGPQGLVSRPNSERFPWEGTPTAEQPAAPPATTAAPPPAPAPAPAPSSDRGSVVAKPADIALRLSEMGKEIKQEGTKTGSDSRASWAEMRFERDIKRLDAQIGPIVIVTKAWVATSVANAEAIFRDEVGKQSKFPEAGKNKVGGAFKPEGIETVADDQDSFAACNGDCNGKSTNAVHLRTVIHYSNAVVVLYLYGGPRSVNAEQVNEWLPRLRERMYE